MNIKDTYIYDDQECIDFARRLWWNSSSFTFVESIGRETEANFVDRITKELLSSDFQSLSAKGNERSVNFHVIKRAEGHWYFIAHISRDDSTYNPNLSEWALSLYPSEISVEVHLKNWIWLSLFDQE